MNILKICEALKNLSTGEEKLREELKDEINKEMRSIKKIDFSDVPALYKKVVSYENEDEELKYAPIDAVTYNSHGYTEVTLDMENKKSVIPLDLVVSIEVLAKIVFLAKNKKK